MNVSCHNFDVAALIDTGSSINIISSDLFNVLPNNVKSDESDHVESIRLANGKLIAIKGTAFIQIRTNRRVHRIKVYILSSTSHPLILGMEYLKSSNIKLDFSDYNNDSKYYNIKSRKRICIQPDSEEIVFGVVPKCLPVGLQGICSNNSFLLGKGILLAKGLVTISTNKTVPLKFMNPTNKPISISRGTILAHFQTLNVNYEVITDEGKHSAQNVQLPSDNNMKCTDHSTEFIKNFDFPESLTPEQNEKLSNCLLENKDIFVTKDNPNLGFSTSVQHRIILKPDFKPKYQKPYRLPPHKREVLRHHLDELLRQGIIAPVSEEENLPITSPIVLVTKRKKPKDSKLTEKEAALSQYRFCCDFRYLNSQCQDFKYAIPDLQELTESFSKFIPNYISSIDLSSGFFQLGISPDSSRYTAFNTCFGTYKFLRLPMGLSTSPSSFQLLMDKILHGLKFKSCLCYLDDVLICSETFEQHVIDLEEVFQRFRTAGLKLGPTKCSFAQSSCVFLGHLISKDGIQPPPDRVNAIQNYPEPKNVKELRRLIGMFNWFRKFIPNFSAKISHLTRLLRKGQNFEWKEEQQKAFDDLKCNLMNSEVLAFPRYDLPFRLAVDSSSRGIGYMLYQIHYDTGTELPRVVRFGSKSLSKWQQSYGPTKLELLGMVVSILDCADYLRGNRFIVECDHQALKPIFQKQFRGAIYERWLAILQQFNFDLQYKPAGEMQVADALSRCHWDNSKNANEPVISPDEDDPFFPYVTDDAGQIRLPTGKHLANYILNSENDDNIQVNHVDLFDCEYDADTDDFEVPKHRTKKKRIKIKENSQERIVNAVQSDPTDNLYDKTTEENSSNDSNNIFDITTVSDKSTDNISETDTISADQQKSDIVLSDVEFFKNCDLTPENLKDLQHRDAELKPIINYLAENKLPDLQKEARKVLLEATDYLLIDGILFHSSVKKSRRTRDLHNYQLVVPKLMRNLVLQMCHDSPFGGHSGIKNTIDRVREHYYFNKLPSIVSNYVQSCHECQIRKTSSFHNKAKIVSFPTPSMPFQVWEMDLCGPFPLSSAGHSYIFTAIDMFSKFVFALPIHNCDHLTVCHAIFQLCASYGVCQTIVSDQGSEFISKGTKELCRLLEVSQEFTPSFAHHCLGSCERSHRTLEERMTPYIRQGKAWNDILPAIVFSMNSCVNASTGYSPFEIIYGHRPQFPLSNPKNIDFKDIPKDIHVYLKQLEKKLQTIRTEVRTNIEKANEKMINRVNKTASPLNVSIGDYVYLNEEPTGQGRKLQARYTGPFIVNDLPSPHMVKLRDPANKKRFKMPVHVNRLKMAYIREPEPRPYLNHDTDDHNDSVSAANNDTSSISTDQNPVPLQRVRRTVKPPSRFTDFVDPDSVLGTSSVESDNNFHKIKRVLAKKIENNCTKYLVQLVGEPSQNSIWVNETNLSPKARKVIKNRPPPLID